MNILFLEGAKHWTGGAKRVLLLARELKKLGHNVIIVCRSTALLGKFALKEGFVVKRINPVSWIDLLSLIKILKILKEHKTDIVDIFSPLFYRIGGLAARILNVKVVFTRTVAFRKSSIKKLINRLMYAMAHKIIAVSDRVKENLIKDFCLDKDKVVVVKDGIDLEEMGAVTEEETNKIKQEFNLDGQKVIGVITRIDENKGHEILLDAIPQVISKIKNIKVIIAGTGKLENKIRECAGRLKMGDKVVITGFRSDIPKLLSVMDVTIMPSYNEGFGMSVLESLASGRAVVGIKGSVPEEVIIDGQTGVIVDSFTSGSLANGIICILNSDYKKMGTQGKELVSKLFSVKQMISKVIEVYESIK